MNIVFLSYLKRTSFHYLKTNFCTIIFLYHLHQLFHFPFLFHHFYLWLDNLFQLFNQLIDFNSSNNFTFQRDTFKIIEYLKSTSQNTILLVSIFHCLFRIERWGSYLHFSFSLLSLLLLNASPLKTKQTPYFLNNKFYLHSLMMRPSTCLFVLIHMMILDGSLPQINIMSKYLHFYNSLF